MRELFKALSELEANLIEQHGVCLLYTSDAADD